MLKEIVLGIVALIVIVGLVMNYRRKKAQAALDEANNPHKYGYNAIYGIFYSLAEEE